MKSLVALLLLVPALAFAQVEIEKPWSRATAPGAKVGVGYLTIHNRSAQDDRLVSAASPVAARVETHITVKDGDVMRMREVEGYDIPAHGSFTLEPSGAHLMLVDLRRPLKEGERVPLTLRFARAGEVQVDLVVGALGGRGPKGHDHEHADHSKH